MAKKKIAPKVPPKDFSELQSRCESKFGVGILVNMKDFKIDCEVIPTGSMSMDVATGVGGYPRGRIVEIYGPEASGKTTLALHAVKSALDMDPTARVSFIDAEHALDPSYMEKLGIDLNRCSVSQPDCGEQAMDIAEMMTSSGLIDVVVIDSVAALVPKAEIEGDMETNAIGGIARIMSQGLRKIVPSVKKNKCLVIFINQIRFKIVVMFGCLHGDTLVNFVDGRSLRIKDVVEQRIEGDVWSYDDVKEEFMPGKIIDWHFNGRVDYADEYLSISMKGPGNKNGRMNITVTPNHKVLTDDGWLEAENLEIGTKIITKQESILNGTLGDFLRGVLSGDSHIAQPKTSLSSSLKIRDNIDIEYAKWKVEKLNKHLEFTESKCNSGVFFTSKRLSELTDVKRDYPNRDPMILLNNFNWLGFAIWVMDDGSYHRNRYQLSIKRFKGNFDKIDEISKELDLIGLYHYAGYGGRITFDKDVSDGIAKNISKYVPSCMRHKLPRDSYEYCDFELHRKAELSTAYAEITDIRHLSDKQMKNKGKYDITVAGTSCYMAGGSNNGVIVHNSPETQPGGNSLKFYASMRIDIRRNESMKDGDEVFGHKAKVKFIKNKVASPFKEAYVPIVYGKGIDVVRDIIQASADNEVMSKNGSWYNWNGMKFPGMEKIAEYFESNPEDLMKLDKEIRHKLFNADTNIIKEEEEEEEEMSEELKEELREVDAKEVEA